MPPFTIAACVLLTALTVAVTYTDVRFRRIPNKLVLATLLVGLSLNTVTGGVWGLLSSLGGLGAAFSLMLMLHVFGAMGAGDVKLFGAVGSVIGLSLVVPAFLLVALAGGVLAVCKMVYSRRVRTTALALVQFGFGLLPGGSIPRFEATPGDRSRTVPYGVAICLGSLVSLLVFRA